MDDLTRVLADVIGKPASLRTLHSGDRGDVLGFDAPGGEKAIVLWQRLRDLAPKTGHWPVLLGPRDEIDDERFEMAEAVGETLEYANKLNAEEWFAERRAERIADFATDSSPDEIAEFDEIEGEWPDESKPGNSFTTPFDVTSRKPLERLVIAMVPTTKPWEVPAFLGLGAWNDCPGAAEHCAAMAYWHRKYGAEIVAATRDVIEMMVTRPPTTREAAIALAREQYQYCTDIVDQGCETISNLASTLMNGTTWFFWWD